MVLDALQSDFPALEIETLTALGEGWNSSAFLVNEQWVFRFPKRKDVEEHLNRELNLLPQLAGILPVAVPQFSFTARTPLSFPFSYAGYRKMEGLFAWDIPDERLDQASVARSFAEVLTTLHEYPGEDALALEIGRAHV